jgi:hypothetical protein
MRTRVTRVTGLTGLTSGRTGGRLLGRGLIGVLAGRSLGLELEPFRDVGFGGAAGALRMLSPTIDRVPVPPMLRAMLLAAALHVVLLRAGTRRRLVPISAPMRPRLSPQAGTIPSLIHRKGPLKHA